METREELIARYKEIYLAKDDLYRSIACLTDLQKLELVATLLKEQNDKHGFCNAHVQIDSPERDVLDCIYCFGPDEESLNKAIAKASGNWEPSDD